VRLFRRGDGYLGTVLYRDLRSRGRFLTVDHWRDEASLAEFRRAFASDFEALDAACARLTRREAHIGDFEPVSGTPEASVGVECIVPILRVGDLAESLRFYEDVLGFRRDWGPADGSAMAAVSRDGRSIMLCQGAQGQPGTWVWIGVSDIRPIYERLVRAGAKVRQPPTPQPWAYEMQVEDPDGHVLRFGAEPVPAPA
jgi:predicted enzyme related to lactoylglutathione lyase